MRRMITTKLLDWAKKLFNNVQADGTKTEVGGDLEVDGIIKTNGMIYQHNVILRAGNKIELTVPMLLDYEDNINNFTKFKEALRKQPIGSGYNVAYASGSFKTSDSKVLIVSALAILNTGDVNPFLLGITTEGNSITTSSGAVVTEDIITLVEDRVRKIL